MNENVDGSKKAGALQKARDLYPTNKKVYVYKINVELLDCIDVSKDLNSILSQPTESRMYNYRKSKMQSLGIWDSEMRKKTKEKLNTYNQRLVNHTEEVIVRGPIDPSRITLYQTL
ncbi:hypothetical protein RBU55_07630 [Pseudomonas chlororaphis subsp. aurantiaca]|uniref:hypothetical protein n=1 Tax=Pseudomonas chlororaphis TaxID=587753 RepID=UPI0027DDF427|nr:hypothetical protein [Pseudomonas chlororaphis]WMJ01413.1 hypothetical protein RBU55_07630 [Pseudomonas chlororaphis subsp. aurantiaca]